MTDKPFIAHLLCCLLIWPLLAQPEDIICVRSKSYGIEASIEAFGQDSAGFLWMKTAGDNLRFDGNKVQSFALDNQRFVPPLKPMALQDAQWRLEGNGLRSTTINQTLPKGAGAGRALLLHPALTGDSVLWVLADSALLCFHLRENRFVRQFRHDPHDLQSLHAPPYRCAFLSREGILWVGGTRGFSKYDHRMQVLRFHDPLPDSPDRAVGTECFLASRHRPGQWMVTAPLVGLLYYDPKRRKTAEIILREFPQMRGMAYDKLGRLIVSTRPVMLVLDEARRHILHRLPPIQDMFDLTDIDTAGHYWHMCNDERPYMLRNDIECFRLDTVRFDAFGDGLPGLYVAPWTWKPDQRGYCWLMTANQVIRISTLTLEKSRIFLGSLPGIRQLPQGFRGEAMRGDTPDGNVWVRSERELICFDFNRPESSLQIFPLPFTAHSPHRLEVDGRGRPWSCNEHGLYKFDPVRKTYAFYDATDGFHFTQRGILHKNVFGSLWAIAEWDGRFAVFDPLKMPEFPAAKPLITRILVHGKPCTHVENNQPLHLQGHENNLRFEFTAPDFRQGRHLSFRYRLLGADTIWIHADTSRTARFFGLAPGNYTFVVQAANREGDWNPEEARFRFVIAAPFYQKAWFLVFCLLSAVGLALGIRRLAASRRRRREQALRTRISGELQQEISTLLSSIEQLRSRQEVLLEQGETAGRGLLKSLEAHIHSAQDALSDMVWSVNPENDPLPRVLARMQAFAAGHNLPEVVFEVAPDIAGRSLPIERRREFYKIYQLALLLLAEFGTRQIRVYLETRGKRLRLRLVATPDKAPHLESADWEQMNKLASRIGARLQFGRLQNGIAEITLDV